MIDAGREILNQLITQPYPRFKSLSTLLERVLNDLVFITVEDVMVEDVITVDADAPVMEAVEDAARFMFRRKIKELPVVEGESLLGLVTVTDLARVQPQMIKTLKKISARGLPPKADGEGPWLLRGLSERGNQRDKPHDELKASSN